ncbi:DUF6575 domain-containing protein [Cohnella phaseoli]|uniref:DUF6575 domain-containing protein n=1 Tax=Cohnella phaseoli TaxID=456490 RepID=A0A3D9I8H7_9BACL|nr:DUF6575 domain-containing protein [Cohnella phaseoli]RED57945.1 hypothetical protein DFP98_13542 [Cohnella phaseoli]
MDFDSVITPLGELFITDVLLFIDEPKIFICKDEKNSLFLAYFIDSNNNLDEWFFVKISENRVDEIVTGNISIKAVLQNPESGWLWKAFLHYEDDGLSRIIQIDQHQISKADLPAKEVKIILKNNTNHVYSSNEIAVSHRSKHLRELPNEYLVGKKIAELPPRKNTTLQESLETKRDVLDVSLRINNEFSSELDLEVFGSTLTTIQQLMYALDNRWSGKSKAPQQVRKNNALNVTTLFAASFGIRIKSQNTRDLAQEPEMTNSLGDFLDLLGCSKNAEQLENRLKTLKPKAVTLFKNLLETFNEHQIEPKIEFASPNNTYKETKLNSIQIHNAVGVIKQSGEQSSKVIEMEGELTGLSFESGKFELRNESAELISGRIVSFLEKKNYRLFEKVSVSLLQKEILNSFSGKKQIMYDLLNIKFIEIED